MSARNGRRAAALAFGALLALQANGVADDAAAPAPADPEEPTLEGSVTLGWRFIGGEGEGRFPQDEGLKDGPRLFGLEFLRVDPSPTAGIEQIEGSANGVGDPNTDYQLALRRLGVFEVEGGHRRDDYSYRATGDPWPYDTVRERSFVHTRWTPSRNLALRLDWNRSTRRGDAFTSADTDIREVPPPAGVDEDIVRDHRPLDQQWDDLTFGLDYAVDIWRFGVTETVRLTQIDDERQYDVPPSRRGADPLREYLRRQVRARSFTTVAKAGASLLDETLDVTLFVTHTRHPLHSRISGNARGFDNAFEGADRRGAFASTLDGENDLRRSATTWRVESAWRPHGDWEVSLSGESDDTIDDASLELTESRNYSRPDVDPSTRRREVEARITDRNTRWSADATWDVTDDLRLRAGEQYLRQDLRVPTDSHFGSLTPTDFTSHAWRTTAGIDVDPLDRLSLSLLAHRTTNDDPHTTPVLERGDDFTFRARWKPVDTVAATAVWRRTGFSQTDDFDSATRTDSVNAAVAWTHGPWSVRPSVTWQEYLTRSNTSFFELTGVSFQRMRDTVKFEGETVTPSIDVRYEITKSARAFATATRVGARGDYVAHWLEASVGAEYDVRKDVTLGLTLRAWRLDEEDARRDDYSAEAAEATVTYRF